MARYKLEKIEGIGTAYAEKLAAVGLTHTDTFLEKAASAKGRKALAAESGLQESQLLVWANMADLMRVPGVGEEFSELLKKSGVDTIKELRTRVPENLAAKMAEVNEAKRLCRRTPAASEVARWVEEAKKLEPAITH